MKHIRSISRVEPKSWNNKSILYMHGYGGFTWEAKRHLKLLQQKGFGILALDFTDILKGHSPTGLIELMDEVDELIQKEGLITNQTTIIGISLGGLVGFNMIKRHKELTKLFIITGGDMTHIPRKKALATKWKLTCEELSAAWRDVNIYSPVGSIRNKHIVMLLPKRDKLIDPNEVIREIDKHSKHNNVELIRTNGGHFRTIISETIIWPRKSLDIINKLVSS